MTRDDLTGMSVITLLPVLVLGLEICQRSDRRHLGIHEDREISTAAAQMLTIGEIVRAAISGDEPLICAHGEEPPTSEGPCRTFHLRILDAGLLRIRLTWDSDLPLRLELRTLNGELVKTACCRSPMELAEPIEVGLYEVEITMLITSLARRRADSGHNNVGRVSESAVATIVPTAQRSHAHHALREENSRNCPIQAGDDDAVRFDVAARTFRIGSPELFPPDQLLESFSGGALLANSRRR